MCSFIMHLKICVHLCIVFARLVLSKIIDGYEVTNDVSISYMEMRLNFVDELIFPKNVTFDISVANLHGLLMYSLDSNDNQLIVNLFLDWDSVLAVEFRGNETRLRMQSICGCNICSYLRLLISVSLTDDNYIVVSCNGRPGTHLPYGPEKKMNHNYPIIPMTKSNSTNSAIMRLIKNPEHVGVGINTYGLQGCIFSVEYKGKPLEMTIRGNSIRKGCKTVCKPETCNGGICIERYVKNPTCDCTKTFGSGAECLDESRQVNKKYNNQYTFRSIKLSWRTDSSMLFQLWNNKTTVQIEIENDELYAVYKDVNDGSKKNALGAYSANQSCILIINFYQNLTFKLSDESTVTMKSSKDLSNEVFEYLILSSGNGVIDIVGMTADSDINWRRFDLDEDSAKEFTFKTITPASISYGVYFIVIPVVILFILLLMWKINLKCLRTKNRKRTSVPVNEEENRELVDEAHATEKDVLLQVSRVLHFPCYSVICCNQNDCYADIVEVVKKSIPPLWRPLVISKTDDLLQYVSQSVRAVQLRCRDLLLDEYVITKELSLLSLSSFVRRIRNWNVSFDVTDTDLQFNATNDGLSFKVEDMNTDWPDYTWVTVELQGEDKRESRIELLVLPTTTDDTIKIIFIEFQKFLIMHNILSSNLLDSFNEDGIMTALNRLITLKLQTLVICDNHSFHSCLNSYHSRRIILKNLCQQKVIYASPLFDSYSFHESVYQLLLQESILLRPYLDDPCVVMLRKSCLDISDIVRRIRSCIGSLFEVILVSNNKILTDNVSIDSISTVVSYVVVKSTADISILDELGKTVNSTTNKCSIVGTDGCFVVKRLKNPDRRSVKEIKTNIVIVITSVGLHFSLMQYRGFYEDSNYFGIVMDEMKESLSAYVDRIGPLSDTRVIFFSKQILDGLHYLHTLNIAHGNLKGSNVLLDADYRVKLTDYGMINDVTGKRSSVLIDVCLSETVRTIHQNLVEHVENSSFSNPKLADIWSFGVLIIDMLTGSVLDHSYKTILYKVFDRKFDIKTENQKLLKSVADSCMNNDVSMRPNSNDLILQDIFIRVC